MMGAKQLDIRPENKNITDEKIYSFYTNFNELPVGKISGKTKDFGKGRGRLCTS